MKVWTCQANDLKNLLTSRLSRFSSHGTRKPRFHNPDRSMDTFQNWRALKGKFGLLALTQGCTRPRPSPFERPSTRYNGGSIPLRGIRLQDLQADCRFDSIAGPRRRFKKFRRFFESLTKLMYIKNSEIAFQRLFGRTHFCVRTLEKPQIFARTSKFLPRYFFLSLISNEFLLVNFPKIPKKNFQKPPAFGARGTHFWGPSALIVGLPSQKK